MACTRSCSGTPLCSALNLCCIQFLQDCGKGCEGLLEGYSVIQIAADGSLEVCSNVGGICTCEGFGTNSTIIDNDDGTVTHDDGSGAETVLDICKILADAYDETPWTALALGAGWTQEGGMQTFQYRCLCTGEVQIRGCIEHLDVDGDNAVPETIATLPATQGGNDCRPGAPLRTLAADGCAVIEIDAAGVITTNPNSLAPRCFDLSFWT